MPDETVWLVAMAFLIAGSVIRTGLGRRIALTLVVWLGRSLLGLGYALCAAEMVLGTLIQSNTARAEASWLRSPGPWSKPCNRSRTIVLNGEARF